MKKQTLPEGAICLTDLMDRDFGKTGTPKREVLEQEIQLELMAEQIKRLQLSKIFKQNS